MVGYFTYLLSGTNVSSRVKFNLTEVGDIKAELLRQLQP